MYAVVAALVLWYRFFVPIRNAVRHRAQVVKVHYEAPGVASIVVRVRDLDRLAPESGQFFRWRFLTRDGWWQSHPFSLSAPPAEDLRITVKELGDHTRMLTRVHPGTRVLLEGPYGAFTAARRTRRKVMLLAGGIGITPLRALLQTMPAKPGDLTLVYRVNSREETVFGRELETISTARGATLHHLVGPPGSTADPFIGGRLKQLVPDLARHDVFVCGPPGFTNAATAALRRAHVPARHIHAEQFAF